MHKGTNDAARKSKAKIGANIKCLMSRCQEHEFGQATKGSNIERAADHQSC